MPVPFQDFTELVHVPQGRCGEPRGEDVALCKQKLRISAEVITTCIQGFPVRITSGGEYSARHRSSGAILVCDSAGQECSPPVSSIPVKARSQQPSRVAGKICPTIVIPVISFLPVTP